MQIDSYMYDDSDHCEAFNEDPTKNSWSKNELRTIIFVAAKGLAPRSVLTSFQSQLPSSDWFEGQYKGKWYPMKDHLSWGNVEVDSSRRMTLGHLINGILGMKGGVNSKEGIYANMVYAWMKSPDARGILDTVITMPQSELGVKLGLKHAHATVDLYKHALTLCSEPGEKDLFGSLIRIEDAAAVLRRTIYEITPRNIYHSTNGNAAAVARALLSHEAQVIACGDEIEVVRKEEEEFETVVISTILKKELFLDALELQPDAINWKGMKKKTDKKGSLMCDVRSILHSILTREGGPCVN